MDLNEMMLNKFKDLSPEEALQIAIQSAKKIDLILDKAEAREKNGRTTALQPLTENSPKIKKKAK